MAFSDCVLGLSFRPFSNSCWSACCSSIDLLLVSVTDFLFAVDNCCFMAAKGRKLTRLPCRESDFFVGPFLPTLLDKGLWKTVAASPLFVYIACSIEYIIPILLRKNCDSGYDIANICEQICELRRKKPQT